MTEQSKTTKYETLQERLNNNETLNSRVDEAVRKIKSNLNVKSIKMNSERSIKNGKEILKDIERFHKQMSFVYETIEYIEKNLPIVDKLMEEWINNEKAMNSYDKWFNVYYILLTKDFYNSRNDFTISEITEFIKRGETAIDKYR